MSKNIKIIISTIVLLIIGIFLFVKEFNSKKSDVLIGLWDIDGNTKYEFDGYGKGKLIVPLSDYEFTYTINDNKLFIDFKNENSNDPEYIFKVDDDKLEITSAEDKTLSFVLKKIRE